MYYIDETVELMCGCRDNWLMVEACVFMSLLVVNIYFVAWDDQQRHVEFANKARRLLAHLDS